MPKTRSNPWLCLLLVAPVVAGCDSEADSPLLARAADHRLTVDEAASLIAGATDVPNDPGVVETVANLWVDYTLLAESVAEDSTLAGLDMGPLVGQQVEVEAILALRDSMIRPDTAVTDEELEGLYEAEGAGMEARARHILLAFPQSSPTAQQLDSLRALAEELRARIVEGESFAELARRYSSDPGSAEQGGDLGYFPRGEMVPSFDQAVFSLEPGDLSEVVRSPYGFHLIRVEDRRVPAFEEVRDEFRMDVQQRRIMEAESVFVAGVMEPADVQVTENGIELTRRMASGPGVRLSERAAGRTVARYSGGEVTVGEVQEYMLTRQPQYRAQVEGAPDDVVREAVIEDLVRRELLLDRALSEGFEPAPEAADSLAALARERFLSVARELGLASIQPQPGESAHEAVERTVDNLLRQMLQGQRQVIPVGAIGYVLRRHHRAEVFGEPAVQQVVSRVADARGPSSTPQQPGGGPPATGQGAAPGEAIDTGPTTPETPGG